MLCCILLLSSGVLSSEPAPIPRSFFCVREAENSILLDSKILSEGDITAVEIKPGPFLRGELEIPADGTYNLWLNVRYGGMNAVEMRLERKGTAPVRIVLERRGPNVSPTGRFWFTSGPWNGGNRVRLKKGKYSFILSGIKRREIIGPLRKPQVTAALDLFVFSTFLEDIRPLLDAYNSHIIDFALAEEAFARWARFQAAKGIDPTASKKKLDTAFKELISLRSAMYDLFDLHPKVSLTGDTQALRRAETVLYNRLRKAAVSLKNLTKTFSQPLPAEAPPLKRPPDCFLLSIDDTEGGGPYPAGSPKWRTVHALGVDLVAFLMLGRYPQQIETPDGRLRFERVDEAIKNVTAEGLKVLLFVDPYPPRHVVRRYGPAVRGLRRRERAGWGWINIWLPQAVNWLFSYLDKYAKHFAGKSAVVGYGFHNEPRAAMGTGPETRAAFQAYLKKQYKDIHTLNRLWHTSYRRWAEIPLPVRFATSGPGSVPPGHLSDYLRFRARSLAVFYRQCISRLHAADPAKLVLSRFAPSCPSDLYAGLDFYLLARAGWDLFSMHDDLSGDARATGHFVWSMARYAKVGTANDECHWVVWESRRTKDQRVLSACVRREMWRELFWGKRLVNLERGLQAAWADWNDSVPDLRLMNETLRICAGPIAPFRKAAAELSGLIKAWPLLHDGVGMLESASTLCLSPGNHRTGVHRTLSFLLSRHRTPVVVPEEALVDGTENLEEFKVLVAPHCLYLNRNAAERILRWIKAGGRLFSLQPCGNYDEWGNQTEASVLGLAGIKVRKGPLGRLWHILNPPPRTNVLRKQGGRSILVEIPIGKGTATILLSCSEGRFPEAFQIFKQKLLAACPASLEASDPMLSLLLRGTGRPRLLLALNHDPYRAIDAKISIAGSWKLFDLLASAETPATHRGGKTSFRLYLIPGGGAAWLLQPLGRSQEAGKSGTPKRIRDSIRRIRNS